MERRSIYDLDAIELVRQITNEMQFRCRALEEVIDASQRIQDYSTTVIEFVKATNLAFFEFVEVLDQKLRTAGFGDAKLNVSSEQPDLARYLHPNEDWVVKRFSLVRAELKIRLRYLAHGEEMHVQTLSAAVVFLSHGGVIEWADGTRELFRSHRENAANTSRFGALDLFDLSAKIGLPARGREGIGMSRTRDEPEIIVLRHICQDERWPGWQEP